MNGASCYLCMSPCDGETHDGYGELVMGRTDLIVCRACDDYLADEPGPWSEW